MSPSRSPPFRAQAKVRLGVGQSHSIEMFVRVFSSKLILPSAYVKRRRNPSVRSSPSLPLTRRSQGPPPIAGVGLRPLPSIQPRVPYNQTPSMARAASGRLSPEGSVNSGRFVPFHKDSPTPPRTERWRLHTAYQATGPRDHRPGMGRGVVSLHYAFCSFHKVSG